MLIRLLLTTKSFRRSLLNHFISKFLHDSFSFRCEVLANGPCLRQVRFCNFLPNLPLHMRRALTLYKLKFSAPGFVHNLSFGHFWSLLVRMRRNSHKTTSGVKFDLKFDFPVPDFSYGKNFRNWTTISCIFSQFSAAHEQKRPEFYFRSNF